MKISWLNGETLRLLSAVELASTCSVYPNPANNEAVVLSNFRVEAIEIYDMSGRMVKREDVSAY
ncbi:MAG: T9SS type A sorting domain-containing protein, partial [Bacteroidales bacterium]|nr:T9SS type A sorting domain-containing protein [Bacteroidales bacterium]